MAAALVKESGIEIDETDPAIIAARQELENMKVTVESDSPSTFEGETEKTPLTEEQIQTVLGMYALYQQQWAENADVLGVQMPFYLQYNDNNEDGLGALGEMLVLAGVTVGDVRSGNYSYDDLTGMILNFHYGDKLGVEYYGSTLRSRRDEALKAVKDSGAKTEYQKLLVLNDWLATVDSFDMSYIMNQGKDEPSMGSAETLRSMRIMMISITQCMLCIMNSTQLTSMTRFLPELRLSFASSTMRMLLRISSIKTHWHRLPLTRKIPPQMRKHRPTPPQSST